MPSDGSETLLSARIVRKPVYAGYLADPFAWRQGDAWYMIGTGPDKRPLIEGRCFPALVSYDFERWEFAGHVLEPPDASLGDTYWAPEVAIADGVFYLYYSLGAGDKHHHLRVAASSSPLGPYKDLGIALTDLSRTPFAIDASPFHDSDGQWYLFYARDYLDSSPMKQPGTGLAVDRLEGMTKLSGNEKTVLRAAHDWQRFQRDRPMYGEVYDWHTVEGPFVTKRDGLYTCFYSGGRWDSDHYGVDFATSTQVTGPYLDTGDGDAARITRTVPGRIVGPGHSSIVIGPDGVTTYIVYHAWNESRTVRSPYVSRLDWDDQGPLPVLF